MSEHRLVYSSDGGDRRHEAKRRPKAPAPGPALPRDGVARVFREKGGRGGKTVTVIRGLDADLNAVASDLKRHCGTGGAVKGDAVEIQGDHRDKVVGPASGGGVPGEARGG